MTQEEKQLLLKDLCARLPYYGLMVRWGDDDFNIIGVGFGRITLLKPFMSNVSGSPLVEEVRPYLRPMSSMTKEEREYLEELSNFKATPSVVRDKVDFYLEHHLDYRGLIPMGLALEAPEGMYAI